MRNLKLVTDNLAFYFQSYKIKKKKYVIMQSVEKWRNNSFCLELVQAHLLLTISNIEWVNIKKKKENTVLFT